MKSFQLLFTVTILAGLALAQDDPPARVARLNYINGQVSLQPAGADNWEAVPLNRPLIAGDRLWADEGSRAELHVGSAALRMGAGTSFTFVALDDRRMQAELVQGSLIVRLRQVFDDETYEIDTPHVSFLLLGEGEYRVDVRPDGTATILTVRSGEGQASGGGQTFTVRPSDQVRISGTDRLTFESRDMPGPDNFDQWARERDVREDQSQSAEYVGRGVTGYEDLDDHGVWTEEPSYGRVWVPRGVPAGWEPYRYGHWEYIAPWGWTWIDDAPWGFAPFHYGRWAVAGVGWVWIPGPVVMRPVYAPALVAWIGGSPRTGFGVSVGWFPLGPREVYLPAHRASLAYVNRVNITNTRVTNIQVTNVYNNASAINNQTYVNRRHAVVISQSDMTSGREVHRASRVVPPGAVQDMRVTRGADVTPRRESGVVSRPAASVPPPNVVNRRTVSRPGAVRNPDAGSVPRPAARGQQPAQEERAPRPTLRERPVPVPDRSGEATRPQRVEPQPEPRQRQRVEPPARVEPRQEQRQEQRQQPRVEPPPRVEPQPEQRQRQRSEPPARVEPRQEQRQPQRVEPPARVEPRQETRQERRPERPAREEKKPEVKKEQ